MKPRSARILGTLLIFTACLGLIISLGGMIFLGIYSGRVSARLTATLDGITKALVTSQNGLTTAEAALTEADTALASLTATLEGVQGTILASDSTFEALSTLLGTDLPATIQATQDSLTSAQESAKNIDGVLTSLSKIPLLGRLVYNPEIPLNETIGGISDSLKAIPTSLSSAKRGIDDVRTSLDTITANLDEISTSTDQIDGSTRDAQLVIDDYQSLMTSLQEQVANLKESMAGKIRLVFWLIAGVLFWLGLAQVGLLIQGLELRSRGLNSHHPAVID